MQLGPRLDESSLSLRKESRDKFHGLDAEHGNHVLVVHMEMGRVVWRLGLGEHPDDDPEKREISGTPYPFGFRGKQPRSVAAAESR